MTIPKPEHLLTQAEARLMTERGAPRQVNLRRAISTAYYGVFHFVLQKTADVFVGATAQARMSPTYALFYRSVDHSALRGVCQDIQKPALPARIMPYAPQGGFVSSLKSFAAVAAELQEQRNSADYDPSAKFRVSDAQSAIATARTAIESFNAADADQQKTFLALLVCRRR